MKDNIVILFSVLLTVSFGFSQIPIEEYRREIEQLKTDDIVNEYWNNLYKIDQQILVNTTDLKIADSISISNMIKAALIFDIHGTKGYNSRGISGFLPILNFSHNHIGQSQIAYWPIIEKCAKIGGAIENFGGNYPAYQLECLSLTFYNYSLFNQQEKYPILVDKLSEIETVNIVDELLKSFQYQNELRKLSEVGVLNSWYLQSFKDHTDEGEFSFVKMSDDNLYLKISGRIQKLELIQTYNKSKIYRLETEPFGWSYIYGNDGSLTLIDENANELIKYTLVK
ncbi:hypothetical protein [Flavobacterium aurantiibacter]|uniref:Uncharacterized protein n=1 Tax=Flavobacterium aurantiibacter TaxID=2023067 RepID=A0A255ZNA6_9FLAO|nr:hypothetical protein [Flavobacterium aurantiibacter]OYQ42936.1 hypothetical protein CHX27_11225 [Flavobacterium aurantiibacter]